MKPNKKEWDKTVCVITVPLVAWIVLLLLNRDKSRMIVPSIHAQYIQNDL